MNKDATGAASHVVSEANATAVQVVFETHSTTEDNERGIAHGWLPGRLSETGRRQAEQLGRRRRGDGIAVVITSDLKRAVETAHIAFGGTNLPILSDARLRECNYGDLNGALVERIDKERPRRLDEPFPGGESYWQVVQRMADLLHDLCSDRLGQRILLIGHAGPRWALDHLLDGVPLADLLQTPFQWQEGWEYTLSMHTPLQRNHLVAAE